MVIRLAETPLDSSPSHSAQSRGSNAYRRGQRFAASLRSVCDEAERELICDVIYTHKIVRFDYTDPFYMNLAREARSEWASSHLFKDHFHPTVRVVAYDDATQLASIKTNHKQPNDRIPGGTQGLT